MQRTLSAPSGSNPSFLGMFGAPSPPRFDVQLDPNMQRAAEALMNRMQTIDNMLSTMKSQVDRTYPPAARQPYYNYISNLAEQAQKLIDPSKYIIAIAAGKRRKKTRRSKHLR